MSGYPYQRACKPPYCFTDKECIDLESGGQGALDAAMKLVDRIAKERISALFEQGGN